MLIRKIEINSETQGQPIDIAICSTNNQLDEYCRNNHTSLILVALRNQIKKLHNFLDSDLFPTYLEILNKSFLIFVMIATVSTGFALLSILFCKDDCSFAHDSVFQTTDRET